MKKGYMIFIGIISALLLLTGCGSEAPKAVDMNIRGDEVLKQQDEEYMVYFYMQDCVYCNEFKPVLEEYEQQEGSLPLYQADIGIESERDTWQEYQIKGVPTLIIFKDMNGQKVEVQRLVGVQKLETIPKTN